MYVNNTTNVCYTTNIVFNVGSNITPIMCRVDISAVLTLQVYCGCFVTIHTEMFFRHHYERDWFHSPVKVKLNNRLKGIPDLYSFGYAPFSKKRCVCPLCCCPLLWCHLSHDCFTKLIGRSWRTWLLKSSHQAYKM